MRSSLPGVVLLCLCSLLVLIGAGSVADAGGGPSWKYILQTSPPDYFEEIGEKFWTRLGAGSWWQCLRYSNDFKTIYTDNASYWEAAACHMTDHDSSETLGSKQGTPTEAYVNARVRATGPTGTRGELLLGVWMGTSTDWMWSTQINVSAPCSWYNVQTKVGENDDGWETYHIDGAIVWIKGKVSSTPTVLRMDKITVLLK